MSNGQKIIRRIAGATDIALYTGEHLLIGRPSVFGPEFREMIASHKPGLTERVILNIHKYASHGAGRLHGVLIEIDGIGGVPLSMRGIVERVAGLVRRGTLLALVMPAVALNALTTDSAQLEEMSADLARQEGVNPELSIEGKSFSDLDGMTDKLVYVLKASGKYFKLQSVATAFGKALTATAIISIAVVLAAWAASHFFGVGFAVDVILVAIGFVMMGWAIFSAVRSLWKCVKSIHKAKSLDDLEKAAKMFADTVTQFGVDFFVGLLTRGAGKMRAKKANAKPDAGGGKADTPEKTKAEIEAENKGKADKASVPAPMSSKSPGAFADDVHPGLHNRSDVEVPYKEYDWDKFKTRREIDLDNLSAEDMKVAKALEAQGRSENEIVELLSSSTGKNPIVGPVNKGDKFYGFQTEGIPKSPDNKYWLDEAAFKDVESKYFKDGAWDKDGVKNYLALPCVNSANSIVTAEAQKTGSALHTTIGKATEELPFIQSGSGVVENVAKIMSGGGTQVTPDPDLLKIIPGI